MCNSALTLANMNNVALRPTLSNLMCALWSRWDLFLFIFLISVLSLLTDAFCGILISPFAEHFVVPEEWWLQGQGSSQLLLIYQSNSITDISVF